jgi:hypothetical protein
MAITQPNLFDAPRILPSPFLAGEPAALTATALRDRGAIQVLERAGDDWKDQAIACIRQHWAGREGIAEDFRRTCQAHGIAPHHPNAWGALTLAMKRQELLEETGEWRSPSDLKSHARPTRVYRVR